MKLNPLTRLSSLLGIVALLAAAATSARAQDYTWTGAGGATNNNWSTTANWDTAPVASGNSTTRLSFTFSHAASTAFSSNNLGSFTLNQLTLSANSTGRTISGNTLAFVNDGGTSPSMLHNDLAQSTISNAISIPGVELTLGGNQIAVVTLSNPITGTGGSIKVANSTWVLSNPTSTFSGGITLNGTSPFPNLVLSGASTGAAGAVTQGSAGTGKITLVQGAIRSTNTATPTVNNDVDIAGNVQFGSGSPSTSKLTLGGNTTLTGDTTRSLALSGGDSTCRPVILAGPIGGTGSSSALTVTGIGTLELAGSGANTYTGLTTMNSGNAVLLLNKTGVNAIAGNVAITAGTVRLGQSNQIADTALFSPTSGTFDLNGNSETIGSVGPGTGTITSSVAGNSILTIAGSVTGDASATITNGSGTVSLVKNGDQMLILRGASTYTGGTTLNQGEIALVSTSALGTGTITLNGGTLRTQDITPQTLANHLEIGGNVTIGIASTNATITLNGTTTLLGTATTRILNIRSGMGANRSPVVFAGAIGDGGNANAITINTTGTGVSGTGNYTTTTFGSGASDTTANTYTGLTTVNGSQTRLVLDKADGTTAIAGNLTQTNGQIVFTRSNQLADTSLVTISGGNFDLAGNSETIAAFALSGGSTTLGNGTLTTSGSTNTVNNSANYTLSTNLAGTNNLIKSGNGILYLSGNNTYSGGTLIQNASTAIDPTAYGIVLQANNALGTGPLTMGDETTFGARLNLNGYNQTVSSLASGSVGIRVVEANGNAGGATSTLTVDQATNTTYSGILRNNYNTSGQLALVKSGNGTLTLSGPNEYTGNTTVTAGTLVLATASVTSPITVGSTAFLGLTPGLTVTSTAAVNLSAGKVKIIGTPGAPNSYTLLTTTSAITGPVVLDTPIANYTLAVEGGNTLKLNYTGASANYASWATGKGIGGAAFNDDYDHDGISNGVEYALDKDPTVSSQPAGTLTGNTITFNKGAAAIANADVSWVIETSTTLTPDSWTPAVTQAAGDPAATIQHPFTPGSPAKNFARLKVVQTTP